MSELIPESDSTGGGKKKKRKLSKAKNGAEGILDGKTFYYISLIFLTYVALQLLL
jgi:hypothetical protein